MSDLVPYAEPVDASNLVPGGVYFQLTFWDGDLCSPEIKTLVFIGADDLGDGNQLVFQDSESFFEIGSYKITPSPESRIFNCSLDGTSSIFELPKLIDELTRCKERRFGQKRNVEPSIGPPASE